MLGYAGGIIRKLKGIACKYKINETVLFKTYVNTVWDC